jgi:molybdopterin-synthase adenylyltransferase
MQSLYARPLLKCSSEGVSWINQANMLAHGPLVNTLPVVVPLLDGKRTLEEIAGELVVRGFTLGDIFAALNWLDRQGLILEAPDDGANALPSDERRLYAAHMAEFGRWAKSCCLITDAPPDPTGLAAQLSLRQAVVVLVGSGVAGRNLIRALAAIGVGTLVILDLDGSAKNTSGVERPDDLDAGENVLAELARVNPFVRLTRVTRFADLPTAMDDSPPNLLVYCSDQFDPMACTQINRLCLDHRIVWLVYRKRLHEIDIGPLIVPRETACFACYENRLRALTPSVRPQDDSEDLNSPTLNLPLGIDLLALEVLKFLTGTIEPVTYGRLWRLNIFSGLLVLLC